ncbi:MAG TPA: beta-ketoacyl-ACP synthase III [Treponemataceae bacterium]|jgi:3-oxoacyl-[acyl-carrier-protein] synthase-3|nr:beta-ketoacyl-ACP synthase III [Treponemataceae bacterium]HOQ92606.1 beta-ketoacyl-ACP synthase III [Treponemataceae bacterium]HPM05526.1 beta-ketoacyl-ACP synthase III [Treponemataceae bacterium]
MSVIIRAAAKALPKNHVINDDLAKKIDTSDEWIRSHTGIGARYIAEEGETSASLGARSSEEALKKAGLEANQVDLIVCATATPDYHGFPANACLIQESLAAENAACFDLSAACSGFLYALDTAEALMAKHNWKYALIIGTEVLSSIVDWEDRATCVLFGDGAGTILLENNAEIDKAERGLSSFILGAQGSGSQYLYNKFGEALQMDGRAVYNFAVGIMTQLIKDLMEKENLTEDMVDYFVCHQANERILSAAAKRLGFKMDKFIISLDEYGNTSSASIPLTLVDMDEKGMLKEGMTIVSAAFGAGLTYAGAVFRW